MTAQRNERYANPRRPDQRLRQLTSTVLGAVLTVLLASTASAQVHAASPQQSMEATTHASGSLANPLRKRSAPAQPRQPRTPPQAHPHRVQEQINHAPLSTVSLAKHKSPTVYTAKQRSVHAPIGPGPVHAGTGASSANKHSIIFVGGHTQPLQPGVKQSLNPQPIPPGHAVRSLPPGSPIKPAGH